MLARSHSHLSAAGETYWQHCRFAATVGLLAVAAGVACLIHAVIPALCTTTASRTIRRLTELFEQRHRIDEVRAESTEAMAFVLLTGVATLVVLPLWVVEVPALLRGFYTVMAYAIPATLLLTNRELEGEPAF